MRAFWLESLPVLLMALAGLVPLFAVQQLARLAPWLARGGSWSLLPSMLVVMFPVFLSMALPVASGLALAVACLRWKEQGCWRGLESLGLSLWRRLVPVLLLGVGLTLWLTVLLGWSEPRGLRVGLDVLRADMQSGLLGELRPGVMNRVGNDNRLMVQSVERNHLKGVVLVSGSNERKQLLFAQEASLEPKDSGVHLTLTKGRLEFLTKPDTWLRFRSAELLLSSGMASDLHRLWPERRWRNWFALKTLPRGEAQAEWTRRALLALSPLCFSLWAFAWFSLGNVRQRGTRCRWLGYLACCGMYMVASRYLETACLKQGLSALLAVTSLVAVSLAAFSGIVWRLSPRLRKAVRG